MTAKTAYRLVLTLALVGLADALYLTVKHYLGGPVPCSLTEGCDTVLSSPYAVFGGLPVALWGVLYYLVVIFLSLLNFSGSRGFASAGLFGLVSAALAASGILVYLQAQVLNAWCAYCLVSAGVTFLIFLFLLFSRPVAR